MYITAGVLTDHTEAPLIVFVTWVPSPRGLYQQNRDKEGWLLWMVMNTVPSKHQYHGQASLVDLCYTWIQREALKTDFCIQKSRSKANAVEGQWRKRGCFQVSPRAITPVPLDYRGHCFLRPWYSFNTKMCQCNTTLGSHNQTVGCGCYRHQNCSCFKSVINAINTAARE